MLVRDFLVNIGYRKEKHTMSVLQSIPQKGQLLCYLLATIVLAGCALGVKIRDGEMAYDRKQYAVAIDMLLEEYEGTRSTAEQARKAYLLGVSYQYTGLTDQSVQWLQTAYNKGYGPEATLALAKAYKKQGNYAAAIGTYQDLKLQVSGRDQEINRNIFVIEQMQLWKEPEDYEYKIALSKFSSPDADYSPTIFEDDFIIFTSDREGSTGGKIYNWTGANYSDLYIVPKNGTSPRKYDGLINSKANDGTPTFNTDYTELFFTRCYSISDAKDATCKIMYSNRSSGIWTEPVALAFQSEDYNYGHPTLIEEDSILVFAAMLPGSLGGHDLYYSQRIATDQEGVYYWSEAEPMPSTINTQGQELFPVGDGDTLYFSSDYLPGYGGLDIFKTYLTKDGQWSAPENLLKPINSAEDDYGYTVDRSATLLPSVLQKGFYTSSRKGYGYDDIYSFEKRRVIRTDTATQTPTPVDKSKYLLNLALTSKSKNYTDSADPASYDGTTAPLAGVSISLVATDGSSQEYKTDANGRLIAELQADETYTIVATKDGYLNDVKKLSTVDLVYPEDELSITINKAVTLEKIFYNQEIVLEDIYYDFNKWNIREDAQPTLDSLGILLRNNPQINIELSSHTDCRGDDEYNMILSQKRAQSAVDYMLSKGLRSTVLSAKGYGETAPSVSCLCESCTEEEHQANRRTTFKILK